MPIGAVPPELRHYIEPLAEEKRRPDGAVLGVTEDEWELLVDQLNEGHCAPFIGAGACHGTLPSAAHMSEEWAEQYGYPFDDRTDLAQVTRFVTVRLDDPVAVKRRFLRQNFQAGPPDFTDPVEPHAALARFPIPVYITTNYDDFMVRALEAAGKTPRQVLCPWYPGAPFQAEDLAPVSGSPPGESPIVFHLHGHASAPESLVLTQDDYIDFLIALGAAGNETVHNAAQPALIPPRVYESLSRMPLLFVGYGLRDTTFMVILRGILQSLPLSHHRRHVSVQLLPAGGMAPEAKQEVERYLTRYFDRLHISVFWGTANEFFGELCRRTGGAP